MPSIFSFLLGEMIYQLRAALDGCAYACMVRETGKDPPPKSEEIYFPVFNTVKRFKQSAFYRLPLSEERKAIFESVQPYSGPKGLNPELEVYNLNRTLRILHDWARADRHRKLHFMGTWSARSSPQLRIPRDSGVRLVYFKARDSAFLERDDCVARFELAGFRPGVRIEANPDISYDIATDEPPPMAASNDTLSNRIKAMFVLVDSLVKGLEDSFMCPSQPKVSSKPNLPG